MITENLSTLKIHKLTQEQYNNASANNILDENALYLTPDEEIDLTPYATIEQLNEKADVSHNHDDVYYTETEVDEKISDINSSVSTTYETKNDAVSKLAEAKGYCDAVKNDLLNGAGEAYDTLKELGDLIDENVDAIDALEIIAVGKADADHDHDDLYDALGSADTALNSAKTYTDTVQSTILGEVTDDRNTLKKLSDLIDNTTSNIQTQLNDKSSSNHIHTEYMASVNPTGTGSFSMNRMVGSTVGSNSHAEGNSATASGNFSHAEGYNTISSNLASHAEGHTTTASGNTSHAEGYQTVASGTISHAEGDNTLASGNRSHAEGYKTVASSNYSHAEGDITTASGERSHAEGYGTIASGMYSHAEGENVQVSIKITGNANSTTYESTSHNDYIQIGKRIKYNDIPSTITGITDSDENTLIITVDKTLSTTKDIADEYCAILLQGESSGQASHAEGSGTIASGNYSHAEGKYTTASGSHSHAEGYDTTASGIGAHVEGSMAVASGGGSHAEGYGTTASGTTSHAEGYSTTASGDSSHAEGCNTKVTADSTVKPAVNENPIYGNYGHAEGYGTVSYGCASHAEGNGTYASGIASHSEGANTTASVSASHAEGDNTTASGVASHAEGRNTTASGNASHAEGYETMAFGNQHVQGHYNEAIDGNDGCCGTTGTAFVIGNGVLGSPSNAFCVHYDGTFYVASSMATSGADYAEFFEWQDSNPSDEDRRGYFVTLDGDKIKIAEPNDYILGIISGLPAVIGNGDENWRGRYILDDFGAFITEEFEYEEEVFDKETSEKKTVIKTGTKYKENPDYDPSLPYVQRKDRPEWDAVGMFGVLAVRDDGTCAVNGYCTVAEGGIATTSESGYRVIKRVSDNVVRVVFK